MECPSYGSSSRLFTQFDSNTGISQDFSHQIPQDLGLEIARIVIFPGKVILKKDRSHTSITRLLRQQTPKNRNFLRNLTLGQEKAEAWCQMEKESVSQEETSHSSDTWPNALQDKLPVNTEGREWAGPHLDRTAKLLPSI